MRAPLRLLAPKQLFKESCKDVKFQEVVVRYLPLVRVPSHISGRYDFGASSLAFELSGESSSVLINLYK